jgi:hypothetical protein
VQRIAHNATTAEFGLAVRRKKSERDGIHLPFPEWLRWTVRVLIVA